MQGEGHRTDASEFSIGADVDRLDIAPSPENWRHFSSTADEK